MIRAPEACLVDRKQQSIAGVAVLAASDRHPTPLQSLAHTEVAQCPDCIARQVQAQPGIRRSRQAIDHHGRDALLIEGAHHREPGDAATDDEHPARSAALLPHALTFAPATAPGKGFTPSGEGSAMISQTSYPSSA
jgi:hypothetical protein